MYDTVSGQARQWDRSTVRPRPVWLNGMDNVATNQHRQNVQYTTTSLVYTGSAFGCSSHDVCVSTVSRNTSGKLHETETEDVVSRPQHPCLRVVGGDTTSEWIDVDASVDSPTRPSVRPSVLSWHRRLSAPSLIRRMHAPCCWIRSTSTEPPCCLDVRNKAIVG